MSDKKIKGPSDTVKLESLLFRCREVLRMSDEWMYKSRSDSLNTFDQNPMWVSVSVEESNALGALFKGEDPSLLVILYAYMPDHKRYTLLSFQFLDIKVAFAFGKKVSAIISAASSS